jgi:hypothetical protein
MQQVTAGNIGQIFHRHFHGESLLIRANGGGKKWKTLSPAQKKEARERLTDLKRLAYLADRFVVYKKSEIIKISVTGSKAVVIAKTPWDNKTIIIVFGANCQIVQMCVVDSGCVHQLFRTHLT